MRVLNPGLKRSYEKGNLIIVLFLGEQREIFT